MRVLLRIVGFVVGAGLGFVGFMLWMLSNDGVGGEKTMKLTGGTALLLGVVFVIAAVLPYDRENEPPT